MIKSLKSKFKSLFTSSKKLDAALLQQLETILLTADVGLATTAAILQELQAALKRQNITDVEQCKEVLRQQLVARLQEVALPIDFSQAKPFVLLMVGVNGAGKTTSLGKIAQQLLRQDKKVLLAAGDTFRAAAIAQLQAWGERAKVPVIAQQPGADSAAVLFDAITSAKARDIDVLLADSAGRLHTQDNLMAELAKVVRVIKKVDAQAPHETLLVLDANMGQNALQQAKQFAASLEITGLCITKLDGSAKGGIVFAIAAELALPIRFIGVGEKIDDLQLFDPEKFVGDLLNNAQ
ncbi:MAG: signal recognition particle-docking protein FtsY [Legionellales bacterium]|nr:MAG: signal recognition particle-docking protein FtsY [Legionellales bacterium]